MSKLKHLFDPQSKLLVKNSSWIFLEKVFRTGLMAVRAVVVARFLGPELFGLYAIVVAFVSLIQEFLNLNVGSTVVKFGATYKESGRPEHLVALFKTALWATVLANGLAVLIIGGLILVTYDFFIKAPDLHGYIMGYALVAGTTYINSLNFNFLRLHDRFKLNAVVSMVLAVVEFLLVVGAAWLYPQNLVAFFIALIIARVLNCLIVNAAAFYEMREVLFPYWKSKMKLIQPEWPEIKTFTFSNLGSRTLHTIMNRGGILLLGGLADANAVAYFALARRLSNLILSITDPIAMSVYPQIAKLVAKEEYQAVKKMLVRVSILILPIAGLFIGVNCFIYEWLIVTLFGEAFQGAAMPYVIMIFIASLMSLFFWRQSLIFSLGLVKIRFYANFVALIIGAGLAYWLIPGYGATGLAVSLLVVNVLVIGTLVISAGGKLNRLSKA